MAQDVSARQQSGALGSQFVITATARPGKSIADIQKVIDEELDRLRREQPEARELQRAVNQIEASFYRGMERVRRLRGKADQLNAYYTAGGVPIICGGSRPLHLAVAVRRAGGGGRLAAACQSSR